MTVKGAGMTVKGAGMTVIGCGNDNRRGDLSRKEIPAFAGMTMGCGDLWGMTIGAENHNS